MRVNTRYRNYTKGTSSMLFVVAVAVIVVVLFSVAVINAFAGTSATSGKKYQFCDLYVYH